MRGTVTYLNIDFTEWVISRRIQFFFFMKMMRKRGGGIA